MSAPKNPENSKNPNPAKPARASKAAKVAGSAKADARPAPVATDFTRLMGCDYPVIAGPMFLVSNVELVVAVSEAGGIGAVPALNWRTSDEFRKGVREIKARTNKPYAVNLIVNQSNLRVAADLAICAEEKVPLVITSLGNPKDTIQKMHAVGSKVICDVTTLSYAQKVETQGADGVIAVSSGAGGHAGPISPLVLIPYLKQYLKIPVIAAGGITTGDQVAATLLLGASAVSVGTRFIATREAPVDEAYKKAILEADPEDIILTKKISGTSLAVIRTPYIDQMGTELSAVETLLLKNPKFKKYIKLARTYLGSLQLKNAVLGPTYKEVWSAGQGVGLIHDAFADLPGAAEILERMMREFHAAKDGFTEQFT